MSDEGGASYVCDCGQPASCATVRKEGPNLGGSKGSG